MAAPEDVSAAYQNTTSLSWDAYLTHLMSTFGLNKDSLKKAWHEAKPGDNTYFHGNLVNPRHTSL